MITIQNPQPKTALPSHEQAARTRRATLLHTRPPAPVPTPEPFHRFIPGWRSAYLYGYLNHME